MGDLDDGNPGVVQRRDDVVHLLRGELVALVVRAVAQAGVGEAQVEVVGPAAVEVVSVIELVEIGHVGHLSLSGVSTTLAGARCSTSGVAMLSPTRVAAAVMMSRLPAYGGR